MNARLLRAPSQRPKSPSPIAWHVVPEVTEKEVHEPLVRQRVSLTAEHAVHGNRLGERDHETHGNRAASYRHSRRLCLRSLRPERGGPLDAVHAIDFETSRCLYYFGGIKMLYCER